MPRTYNYATTRRKLAAGAAPELRPIPFSAQNIKHQPPVTFHKRLNPMDESAIRMARAILQADTVMTRISEAEKEITKVHVTICGLGSFSQPVVRRRC